jgi:sigma-B regulation protein RsbU (phosphoserine phosphatase)
MNEPPIEVLLIEDVPKYARAVREMLEDARAARFNVTWAETLEQGLTQLGSRSFSVILLDVVLSQDAGLASLIQVHQNAHHTPVIVLSSHDDQALAASALQGGAEDYLIKDEINTVLLVRSIRYATDRKRSEAALLQAEEKYRSIYEHIVEGIFQTTPDGHYISANPALAKIYGYGAPEELMQELCDIGAELYVEPGRRAEFVALMEKSDIVTGFESRIYRKDHSIIWISENVRAVRDQSGKLLYYEGTVEDITERKRTEQNLLNSEALYHSLVETLPQNIFRKNLAEQFTFANQRFCQTLGRPLEEILGKTDFDFFPPELAAKYQKDDQIILETGKMFETVEENRPPGGGTRYVNVVKTPLYDSEGRIIGLQGIFWDITERKQAEERARKATLELARSREELRRKNGEMEEDLRMAREIQQAMIPQQYPCFPRSAPPELSRLCFCHRYLPTGAVGGDFFNVRALSDTKAVIFICDVMGHGVRSALITAILRALVEELTSLAVDPGELLTQINRDLRSILKQSGTPLFTTAFSMVADIEEGRVYFANAGHPKPMVLHRDSGQIELLHNKNLKPNPALGLMDNTIYPTSAYPLKERDMFMLFTDGVYDVEAEGELLDTRWLEKKAQERAQMPMPEMFDSILEELRVFAQGKEFPDDICLVGMEVARGGAGAFDDDF